MYITWKHRVILAINLILLTIITAMVLALCTKLVISSVHHFTTPHTTSHQKPHTNKAKSNSTPSAISANKSIPLAASQPSNDDNTPIVIVSPAPVYPGQTEIEHLLQRALGGTSPSVINLLQ